MNPVQTQTSSLPSIPPPVEALQRWWNTIYCQTEELWQATTSRDTGKIYKNALWKTWQIIVMTLRLLLLITISVLGIGLFVWLLGYHSGNWLRERLEADNPTPVTIFKRLWQAFLLPFQYAAIWLDEELKKAFGWDLKLTKLLPPIEQNSLPAGNQTPTK